MKKICLAALLLVIVLTGTASAPIYRGEGSDPTYPQLGVFTYFGWPAGLQLWHTPTANFLFYEAGHTYRHMCLMGERNLGPCGTTAEIPNREPYSLTGHAGDLMTCSIWDLTTNTTICPYD